MIRHPPRSTLFPYPTLSRSRVRCEPRAFDQRRELGPDQLVMHAVAEPAIGSRHHVFSSDRLGKIADPARDQFGMLDDIGGVDRKSTRLNSSHSQISYAVFCL